MHDTPGLMTLGSVVFGGVICMIPPGLGGVGRRHMHDTPECGGCGEATYESMTPPGLRCKNHDAKRAEPTWSGSRRGISYRAGSTRSGAPCQRGRRGQVLTQLKRQRPNVGAADNVLGVQKES